METLFKNLTKEEMKEIFGGVKITQYEKEKFKNIAWYKKEHFNIIAGTITYILKKYYTDFCLTLYNIKMRVAFFGIDIKNGEVWMGFERSLLDMYYEVRKRFLESNNDDKIANVQDLVKKYLVLRNKDLKKYENALAIKNRNVLKIENDIEQKNCLTFVEAYEIASGTPGNTLEHMKIFREKASKIKDGCFFYNEPAINVVNNLNGGDYNVYV